MGTQLKYHIWDGGQGFNDRQHLIGYCKESPIEVLGHLIKHYCIHSYKGFRPIQEYPSNVSGIEIYEAPTINGVEIIGCLKDMFDDEYMIKSKWNLFTINKFKQAIDKEKEFYLRIERAASEGLQEAEVVYSQIINETF